MVKHLLIRRLTNNGNNVSLKILTAVMISSVVLTLHKQLQHTVSDVSLVHAVYKTRSNQRYTAVN